MILGVGLDVLDVNRVEQELAKQSWSPDEGIFTAQEVHHCAAARHPALWFAACFAVKEAALKALGLAPTDLGAFSEAEVAFLEHQPTLIFHQRLKAQSVRMGVRYIRLALAPSSRSAGALVVLES